MLHTQEEYLTGELNQVIAKLGYKPVNPEWRDLPFRGAWGLATSVAFRLASQELEDTGLDKKVKARVARERAPEIAASIAELLRSLPAVERVEAAQGYVNIYFDVPMLAKQMLDRVLTEGADYGRGERKSMRIMVEYSQPNTHKAFHVGHLRNVCLGDSLSLILDFAGFDTIPANYIGDIGMHVIRCLWCYRRFHDSQEPSQSRGKWLGQIYVEAGKRLDLREHVLDLVKDATRIPGLAFALYNWIKGNVRGDAQLALLYKLDPTLQAAINDAQDGLKSAARPVYAGDLLMATAEESGATPALDALNLDELKQGLALPEYVALLDDLLTAKSVASAQDTLKKLTVGADSVVREYVPVLWPHIGEWLRIKAKVLPGDQALGDADSELQLDDLLKLYDTFTERIAWWPELEQWNAEVKQLFLRWDAKDPEIVALWERTRGWSLDEFHEIYDLLGAKFNVWFYESQVEEEGKEIVADMLAKGIATDLRSSEPPGPVLVYVDRLLGLETTDIYGNTVPGPYSTLLILRSDGTSLYSTKDLALAKRKFEDYGVDYAIYVVDVRQSFYFRQVFKTLELWGFEQAKNCYHLAYEIVTLPGGTMSSRAGNIVPFEDFAEAAIARALSVIETKNPNLDSAKKGEIARVVALGAMKYSMLSADDNKVIVFNLDEALSFDGRSAPYIQYSHARACRILENAGAAEQPKSDYSHLSRSDGARPEEERLVEIQLVEAVARFPEVVAQAASTYKPHMVAGYVFELASLFTEFYHKCDVVRGDIPDSVRAARLQLVRATRQVLANGLALLRIEAPEVM